MSGAVVASSLTKLEYGGSERTWSALFIYFCRESRTRPARKRLTSGRAAIPPVAAF